jgi:hypothetical protein
VAALEIKRMVNIVIFHIATYPRVKSAVVEKSENIGNHQRSGASCDLEH